MQSEQDFYESKFTASHPWKWYHRFAFPIHLGLYKTYWLQRHMKKGVKVLDLGCGGGREYFAKHFQMTGVDISQTAAANAKNLYLDAVAADVRHLPFADQSFDGVMSLDLLGHIPRENKEQVISEIWRVLKPEGITAHYIETEQKTNILKQKYPELYDKNFILKDGHFGLETPSETIKRFQAFHILKVEGHAGVIGPIEDYVKRFDNEMRGANFWIWLMTGISKSVHNHKYLKFVLNCMLGTLAKVINPFLPFDESGGIFLAAKKEK